MKYVKDFRGFLNEQESEEILEKSLVLVNPEALKAVEDTEAFKTLKITDKGYEGSEETLNRVVKNLIDSGFHEVKDYQVNESTLLETAGLTLEVKERSDEKIVVTINGHDYSYSESGKGLDGKKQPIDFKEVCRKFEKMMTFSAGRALQYLIKNTKLIGGSKKKNKDNTTPDGVNEDLNTENIGHVSIHATKNTVEFTDEEKKLLKQYELAEASKGNAHNDEEEHVLKVGNNHFIFVFEDGNGVEYSDAELFTVLNHQGIAKVEAQ